MEELRAEGLDKPRSEPSIDLEKESEIFKVRLYDAFLEIGKSEFRLAEGEKAAKIINQRAGQYVSDGMPLVYLGFSSRQLGQMEGVHRNLKSNYIRILDLFMGIGLKSVGEIRDTDSFTLLGKRARFRTQQLGMPSILFFKTAFARPQQPPERQA